ncbi:restriction endonuclease subunit S [Arthrobacter sp. D3-16]
MMRLKYSATVIAGQSPDSADVHELTDGMPFVQGNAEFGARNPSARFQCSSSPKIALSGDILVSVRAPVGALNVADQTYGIGRGLAAVRPSHINGGYFWWWMHTQVDELQSKSTGSTFAAVSATDIANLLVPVEDLRLQNAIAAFLESETAQIDDLIIKQERLIELLAEKRQAIITQAVTKGLDPTATTKHSGVPWLGDIPSEWTINRCSRLFRAQKGREAADLTKEACAEIPGPYPVYSGQTANDGIMARVDHYEFDSGTDGVLFSTTVGARAMSAAHIYGKFNLSQNCMIIRPLRSLNTRYFYYQFQVLFRYERAMIPEHMQPSFRMEDLYAYSLAAPSEIEQREISEYLDRATKKLDDLALKVTSAILLLKERRSALISAAVTGKIDVTNEGVAA